MQGFHVWQIGSPVMSWIEFGVWFKFLPSTSQTFQQIRGPQWSPEMHRLTDVLETLMAANWQRGGGKGQKPKSVKRPGVGKNDQRFGKAAPLVDVRARLMRLNGRAPGG